MLNFEEEGQLKNLEESTHSLIEEFKCTPLTEKSTSQRLSHLIQSNLSHIRRLTRDVEALVEELDSEEEQQYVARLLTMHKSSYEGLTSALRAAALEQHRVAKRKTEDARAELLGGADVLNRAQKLATEGGMLSAAQGATDGLRRTRAVLAEEINHTSATLATMEVSHHRLRRTKDEYGTQHASLRKSKGLLGVLDWQNKSETFMLWVGLIIFMSVALYIVHKRTTYFVPEALRPMSLIRNAVGIVKLGRVKKIESLGGQDVPKLQAPAKKKRRKKVSTMEVHSEL